ncbi:hypothetical protein WISP_01716 [Willisornis vidua]|uniref:TRAF-type domain-containing protein n=1 Tax=Willisornis vidua TaxID=1566151 RepID=A0ABQ9DU87_9PASS|nr:hypothetical protein WISP_01716 [Willisornis vidua]
MAENTSRALQDVPGSSPGENEFPFGYPTSICEDVPGQKYLCSNCNNILKKALQTLCGHRYCSACLAWIVRDKAVAPGDPRDVPELRDKAGAPGDVPELRDKAVDPGDVPDVRDKAVAPGDPRDVPETRDKAVASGDLRAVPELRDKAVASGDVTELRDKAVDPGDLRAVPELRNNKNAICQKCKEEDPDTLSEESLLAEERAFGDAAINKEISELKVHCVTLGCSWSGIMKDFEEHQSLCDYALIPCHTGCGHVVMRRKLAEHLENGCANNVTLCQQCQRSLPGTEHQVRTLLLPTGALGCYPR